jgi:hypothetical protein
MVGMERTPEETLKICVASHQKIEATRLTAMRARNQAIRAAMRAGMKQVDVVRITGLTREQVRKIAKGLQPQETVS